MLGPLGRGTSPASRTQPCFYYSGLPEMHARTRARWRPGYLIAPGRLRPILGMAALGATGAFLIGRALTRVVVTNRSMLPTLHPGDRLLILRYTHRWPTPRRGDVVLVRAPALPTGVALKRIVGLPGERVAIRAGRLVVNRREQAEPYVARATPATDAEWSLGPDEYVLLGDNRPESRDSRHRGPIVRAALLGRVFHRYWLGLTHEQPGANAEFIDIHQPPCQNALR